MNLTKHFEKYGFNLSESCKKELEKYPDGQKTWYLDSRALTYEGNGFEDKDTGLDVSLSKSSSGIRLSMNMPQDKRDDLLGYEIIKNGKVIAFTTSSSYTDTKAEIKKFEKRMANLKRLITRCLKSIIQRLQALRAMMDLQLKIL